MQNVRSVSCVTITLSKDPLDASHPGYQAPIPAEDVVPEPTRASRTTSPGGRGRRRTRGSSRRGGRGNRTGGQGSINGAATNENGSAEAIPPAAFENAEQGKT